MRLHTTFAVAVLGLVVAACGVEPGASETTTTVVEATTTTLAAATTTTTAAAATSTTTAAATTTTSGSPVTTILRGDPVDLGPPAGAELAVIGVDHDDVLNLRAAPGADQPIVDEIPPTYDELIALGESRSLPAFWTKVDYEGTEGWVNMAYLGYIGVTDDITSEVIDHFGERPEASTMAELGRMIAEALASDDPPSRIVNSVEETGGDLGEVTFDVVGLGDDSVRGIRLHIFAENLDGHFQLRTVEQTVLCDPARGVDDDGICA